MFSDADNIWLSTLLSVDFEGIRYIERDHYFHLRLINSVTDQRPFMILSMR